MTTSMRDAVTDLESDKLDLDALILLKLALLHTVRPNENHKTPWYQQFKNI